MDRRNNIPPIIFIVFLALAVLSTAVLADDTWQSRSTAPEDADHFEWVWQGGGDINDVFMIDQYYGWAAGDNLLLSTTDGGNTWQARDAVVGTEREYNSIAFVDRQNGWLVGGHDYRDLWWNQAVIMHTTDGGETWQEQLGGESNIGSLDQVQFIDANVGWAADYGHHFLRTTDGGATWDVVQSAPPGPFFFLDANTGWMARGGDGVYHTIDGGVTWTESDHLATTIFNSIWFADTQHGWMTGGQRLDDDHDRGVIFATTNGGLTWTKQYQTGGLAPHGGLFDAVFKNASSGWAVGSGGRIVSTTNGGASWIPQDSGMTADFRSIQTAGGTLWAAGEGAIALSEDGGANWDAQGKSWSELHSVVALNEDAAWAAGDDGTILHTTNAGRTWMKQSGIPNLEWYAIDFSGTVNGWAVSNGGYTIATTDGGVTWSLHHLGTPTDLHGAHFPTATKGWAVGDHGVIWHTTDGGLHWTGQNSTVTDDLKAVHFVDEQEGWVVGVDPNADFQNMHDGVLLHTTNGGQTWTNLGNKGMWDVDFVGSAAGWTVDSNFNTGHPGDYSFIFRTTDSGLSWAKIPDDTSWGFARRLRAIDFVSPGNGWLGGDGLLRSGTGGDSWWPKLELTGKGISDLAFVGPDDGWAVGEDGLILHRQLKPMSQVAAWEDDTCVQEDVGNNRVDWIKVRLGQSDRNYTSGFRFQGLDIPRGAVIQQARLSLSYAEWHKGLPVALKVYAENTGSSLSFADANPLANHRPRTAASVDWTITETPPAWFDSPDLSDVIQEVVDRPDWQRGNALSLIIRDNSEDGPSHYLDVIAYDLNVDSGAKLSVAYYIPDVTPTPTYTPTSTHTPTPTRTPAHALWLPLVRRQ
jgi:photosystem II stability/assembly factor-like uncharacterized protein